MKKQQGPDFVERNQGLVACHGFSTKKLVCQYINRFTVLAHFHVWIIAFLLRKQNKRLLPRRLM